MRSGTSQTRFEKLAQIIEQLQKAGFPEEFIEELVREHIVVDLRNLGIRRQLAELN